MPLFILEYASVVMLELFVPSLIVVDDDCSVCVSAVDTRMHVGVSLFIPAHDVCSSAPS